MRIYNRGSRNFVITGLVIQPGRHTDVPKELEEQVKKMLVTYKSELIDSEVAEGDLQAKGALLAEKDRKIAEQDKLIKNLQNLLTRDTGDSRVAANRRAAKAEDELEKALDRITALEAQLSGKAPAPAAPPVPGALP
jgi:hypothetical protein